jgi:hypothetical protein
MYIKDEDIEFVEKLNIKFQHKQDGSSLDHTITAFLNSLQEALKEMQLDVDKGH